MLGAIMGREHVDGITRMRQAAEVLLLSDGARALAIIEAVTPALVFKGAALAELLWSPGERNMTDVDLLVDAARLVDARRSLTDAGWTLVTTPGRPVSSRYFRAFSVKSPRGSLVDVHAHVAQRLRWPVPTHELFARAVPFRLGGRPALRPSDGDALLLAAVNDAKDDLLPGGSSVEDIARLIARGSLEWISIVERARRYRVTVATWLALERARTRFGAQVPSDVRAALRPRRAPALAVVLGPGYEGNAALERFRRVRQAVMGSLTTDSPPRFLVSALAWGAARLADAAVAGVGAPSAQRTPGTRDAPEATPPAWGRR